MQGCNASTTTGDFATEQPPKAAGAPLQAVVAGSVAVQGGSASTAAGDVATEQPPKAAGAAPVPLEVVSAANAAYTEPVAGYEASAKRKHEKTSPEVTQAEREMIAAADSMQDIPRIIVHSGNDFEWWCKCVFVFSLNK